jgi:cytochrome d ubiquinol oxidase subunit I
MVALGFAFIGMMAYFFYRASFRGMRFPRWALWGAVAVIPTPWIAAELGWFVAEFGRQPWTVDGVLPTAMSVSHLGATELLITLAGFVTFYSVLFIVEMGLMVKYIRKGPFLDVEETDAWMARHEHRLRTHDGNVPGAIATPAE